VQHITVAGIRNIRCNVAAVEVYYAVLYAFVPVLGVLKISECS
jgi:hypothetical protein